MIEEDRITFAGFPLTDDPKRTKAFMQLVSLMNRMAKEQKHTLARPVTGYYIMESSQIKKNLQLDYKT